MALVVLLFANLGLYAQAKIAVITGEVFDRQFRSIAIENLHVVIGELRKRH